MKYKTFDLFFRQNVFITLKEKIIFASEKWFPTLAGDTKRVDFNQSL